MDVTQEIEQRAQQAAQAGADHCALCSISCVTSTLASVYITIPARFVGSNSQVAALVFESVTF